MAAKRTITVELTGPAVGEWLAMHLPQRGQREPDATNTGPLGPYNTYEGKAEWHIPYDDQGGKSWKLIAYAVKQFAVVVPDGKELLEAHESGVHIKITGGPR